MFRDITGGSKEARMAGLKSLYDTDFLACSKQQAEALRAALRNGSDQRLDLGNLAEEIDDLGKSVRRELQSQIRRIVRHLLKLEHSPAKVPRRAWAESIVDARAESRTCWRQVQA
jgi:beta-glucosidase-like glycosyl hydrolase